MILFAALPEGDAFPEFSCRFSGIERADTFVRLAFWIDFHGTLWFDDLRIYRESVDANAFLIEPACATFFQDSGKFRIRIHLPQEYQNLLGVVELFKDGKCLQRKVIKAGNSWREGAFGKLLPPGEASLRITLSGSERKQRIKTVEMPVYVRPQKNPPRARSRSTAGDGCGLTENLFWRRGSSTAVWRISVKTISDFRRIPCSIAASTIPP